MKYYLKQNAYKRLTRYALYDLLLDVSAIERSVLRGNVNWNLKMTSAIERSSLCSIHYVEVLLWQFDNTFKHTLKRYYLTQIK